MQLKIQKLFLIPLFKADAFFYDDFPTVLFVGGQGDKKCYLPIEQLSCDTFGNYGLFNCKFARKKKHFFNM